MAKGRLSRRELEDALRGAEVSSVHFETIVSLGEDGLFHTLEGKKWKPTLKDLRQLFEDQFEQEFGTSDVTKVLENEGIIPKRPRLPAPFKPGQVRREPDPNGSRVVWWNAGGELAHGTVLQREYTEGDEPGKARCTGYFVRVDPEYGGYSVLIARSGVYAEGSEVPPMTGGFKFNRWPAEEFMALGAVRQVGTIRTTPGDRTVAYVSERGDLNTFDDEIRNIGLPRGELYAWWNKEKARYGFLGAQDRAVTPEEEREDRQQRYQTFRQRRITHARLTR